MSKSSNDISQQIMNDTIDQNDIVDKKVFFAESKIDLILRKHSKKRTSNIESIRKPLNIMLNEKNLNTLFKKLKKFKQRRCYKCKELGHRTSTCESELKSMSAKLKEIVKLFDSKN